MTQSEVLAAVAAGKLSVDDATAQLSTLKASTSRISYKVSEKGGLSVYGLQRWPITLYREQWEKLLAKADEIRAFIKANSKTLTTKGD